MNSPTLVLPFGLPPTDFAKDLLREFKLPSLATLLGKAGKPKRLNFDQHSHCLAHEAWIAQRLNLALVADNSPAIAPVLAKGMDTGATPDAQAYWFVVQPAHIQLGREHMLLEDARALQLEDPHARILFAEAQNLIAGGAQRLVYLAPNLWLLRADDWADLRTATPDAATSQDLDVWLARGPNAVAWRSLLNLCQMQWHEHAVNQEREARGLSSVNAMWLWGGGNTASWHQSNQDHVRALTQAFAPTLIPPGQTLDWKHFHTEHGLIASALAADWGLWLQQMNTLEDQIFAPILQALQNGEISELTIAIGDANRIHEFTLGRSSLYKFWKPASLEILLT